MSHFAKKHVCCLTQFGEKNTTSGTNKQGNTAIGHETLTEQSRIV